MVMVNDSLHLQQTLLERVLPIGFVAQVQLVKTGTKKRTINTSILNTHSNSFKVEGFTWEKN